LELQLAAQCSLQHGLHPHLLQLTDGGVEMSQCFSAFLEVVIQEQLREIEMQQGKLRSESNALTDIQPFHIETTSRLPQD
jgi:hypothetical protein